MQACFLGPIFRQTTWVEECGKSGVYSTYNSLRSCTWIDNVLYSESTRNWSHPSKALDDYMGRSYTKIESTHITSRWRQNKRIYGTNRSASLSSARPWSIRKDPRDGAKLAKDKSRRATWVTLCENRGRRRMLRQVMIYLWIVTVVRANYAEIAGLTSRQGFRQMIARSHGEVSGA